GATNRADLHRRLASAGDRLARLHPDSAFARQWRLGAAPYLEHQEEFVGLLPDDQSCLLDWFSCSHDDTFWLFLVTRHSGLKVALLPKATSGALRQLTEGWMTVYDSNRSTADRARAVYDTCAQLYTLLFDTPLRFDPTVPDSKDVTLLSY